MFFAALALLWLAAMSYSRVGTLFTTVGFVVVIVYTANVLTRWFLSVLPKDVVSAAGKAVLITGEIWCC